MGDYGRGYSALTAAACRELKANILGLQEVDNGVARSGNVNQAQLAAEASGMNYFYSKARTYRGRGEVGNALLVRGEIRDAEVLQLRGDYHTVKLGKHRAKLVPEPRNAIIANVSLGGLDAAVGVAHVGGDRRREQLARVADALSERALPQILLGDFNLWPHDVKACLEPYGFEVTHGPNTNPSWEPRQQIDHIVLKGLQLHTLNALPRLPVSDHLALMAEVEVVTNPRP